ncbi:hypothetical protein DI272_18660 [Streptomyces sp. Act143]|uniref:hypothetical protein n=1 Tax=Streptomyces sp. Act143 TaxID=2200760 RepID=UPI000D679298|nr:hypothetical protein [Streptomyces sp. Act143]PWI15958.1 hypothetical protein DI272_18660 [Streptomyces sp. Act143]
MAGPCGRTYRVDPRLDPAACNALQETTSGLLVPRAVLQGVATGGAIGTDRSVDIDVQAPAAGACPETWTVGARLTPVSGEAFGTGPGQGADLQPVASGTWVSTGAQVLLPEAGTYNLTADFFSSITATTPFAVAIDARLFNVTLNAALANSQRRVQYANINIAGTTANMLLQNAGSLNHRLTVSGPTSVRLEGARTHVGFNDSTASSLWGARLGFTKVSD